MPDIEASAADNGVRPVESCSPLRHLKRTCLVILLGGCTDQGHRPPFIEEVEETVGIGQRPLAACLPFFLALLRVGTKIPIRTAITAMTTRSSMSVKPLFLRLAPTKKLILDLNNTICMENTDTFLVKY